VLAPRHFISQSVVTVKQSQLICFESVREYDHQKSTYSAKVEPQPLYIVYSAISNRSIRRILGICDCSPSILQVLQIAMLAGLPLHKKPLDTRTVSAVLLTLDKYSESKKPIYTSDAVIIH